MSYSYKADIEWYKPGKTGRRKESVLFDYDYSFAYLKKKEYTDSVFEEAVSQFWDLLSDPLAELEFVDLSAEVGIDLYDSKGKHLGFASIEICLERSFNVDVE